MRMTGLGALVGAGLMLLAMSAIGQRNEAAAQHAGSNEPGSELITLTSTVENRQQLTIIDPRSRVMSVYHIDPASGVVSLKSVRNFQWDLLMSEFNGVSPLPREIRAMLDNR
jgi:hypothetical protein